MKEKIDLPTGVEVKTEKLGGDGVNINHFKVEPDKRGEGRGTEAMTALLDYFSQQGREYVVVNIGTGGRKPEDVVSWLTRFGFDINEASAGHVDGILELNDYGEG